MTNADLITAVVTGLTGAITVAYHRRLGSWEYRRRFAGRTDLTGRPIPARVEQWIRFGYLVMGIGFLVVGVQALLMP
jgi:hypothetical protein